MPTLPPVHDTALEKDDDVCSGHHRMPECRSKLIVPVSGLWTSIPAFAAGILALWYVEPLWADTLLIAGGALVSGLLNYKYVELI